MSDISNTSSASSTALKRQSAAASVPSSHSKPSEYAAAADPAKYRVPNAPLFMCAAHGDAAVLCSTAGKTGRNGRTAAVGATILWLTCPYVNNLVARLERHGGVQSAMQLLETNSHVRDMHVASHAVFEARAEELLDSASWEFFSSHFVLPRQLQQSQLMQEIGVAKSASSHMLSSTTSSHATTASSNSPTLCNNTQRKYGNAAVSNPADMKCLHALVGQALGGAENPIGMAVLNYILWLYSRLPERVTTTSTQPTETSSNVAATDGAKMDDVTAAAEARLRTSMDSEVFLRTFLERSLCRTSSQFEMPFDGSGAAAQCTWVTLEEMKQLTPDLCKRCYDVIVFLEGKAPSKRKKRRVN